MKSFLSNVQSFVHSITTNDHYASYESQYRSSPNSRNSDEGLYTSASASHAHRTDEDGFSRVGMVDGRNSSSTSVDQMNTSSQQNHPYPSRHGSSSNLASASQTSLNRVQYTPGMRSAQIGNGIPMQDYADGAPPPPSVALSWRRIDQWMDNNYPELFDQLTEGVTSADLNELESDLDCNLPLDVRDSYMVHDGQEGGGHPTGLIFGITFLDLEGISEEWSHWKNTAVKINKALRMQKQQQQPRPMPASRAASSSQASTSSAPPPPGPPQQPRRHSAQTRLSWLDRQESIPDGHIQRVYAHPAWIPLAKDGEGNNIGIDLAPGPRGRWGQVILFGREFDRKYVVATSWAHFLATFADDLESGDHYILEDVEEAEFRFKAPNGRLVSYYDVLRSRVDRQVRKTQKSAVPPSSAAAARPGSRQASSHTQPSAAARQRESQPSTRNSSPTNTRRQSARAVSGDLISPVGSSTNLPATGLSTSSRAASPTPQSLAEETEPETEEPKDAETKDQVENKENIAATENKAEEVVKSEVSGKAELKTDDHDEDEVDLLKDELTEVEI